MDTKADPREIAVAANKFCDALTDEEDEAARELMSFIAGKWPLWVLHVLAGARAPMRFSRLKEEVDGVSQKMLTQTLRQLERDGFVTRTLHPQVPPRVEYALTDQGRDLLAQVFPLWRWTVARIAAITAARRRFDAAR